MSQISAQLVNELRSKTGQGMMECKKMLAETGGDIDKAIDAFRKKGVKASISQRAATEGRVVGLISPDSHRGVLVEINCNTDFTARSAPVQELGTAAAKLLLANPSADAATDPTIAAAATAASQQTGENVRIGRTAVLSNPAGRVGFYHYTVTGKIGVLVSVTGNATDELLRDLGVHITAKKPVALALKREHLPADVVAKERDLAVAQAKESGKPQPIAEKIAEGKMRLFYEERVLLDQEFIQPDKFKGSVAQMVQKASSVLVEVVRLEVGQA